MRVRRVAVACALLILPLLVVACWHGGPRTIPTGVQMVAGVVKPTEISAIRRGTDILVQNGSTLYYLESSTVNLQKYEDREVQLEGTVELNTDPSDIPVLVVSKIVGGPSIVSRTWSIPPLGITIETPSDWRGKVTGQTAQFTASGATSPTLMLFLDGEERLTSSTGTTSLTVAQESLGLHAVLRTTNPDTGDERTEIDLRPTVNDPASDVLTLIFSPTSSMSSELKSWSGLKDDILHSIKFTAEAASSSTLSSSSVSSGLPPLTGSGVGMPCGGPAGVLCPKGLYCNVTDVQANVGQCQAY